MSSSARTAPATDAPNLASAEKTKEWLERSERRRRLLGQVGVPLVTVLLIVVFTVVADGFLSVDNFKTIASDAALPVIVAIGLTMCLAAGEFDLSLTGVAGLATVTTAQLLSPMNLVTILAIGIVLGLGLLIGAFNGILVGYLKLPALIVTIAVGAILNGAQYVVTDSQQIYGGFPEGLVSFCRGSIGPIPNLAVVAALVAVGAWLTLERSTLGRHVRAVGGNAVAARIAGINNARVKLWVFVISGGLTTTAGLLFAGQQTTAYPMSGLDVLLPSFAACFIGAAMFKIGEFNVPGTVVGVIIATITSNGLILMSVPAYATYFFQGAILLAAILFARLVSTERDAL
ncbi:hypothetical protein CH281_18330 [Rhodococcus sp. 06-221-2]|nr:Ribose import permease protein RbsC [Rhodococcus fascians]OZD00339.1 hypothetical protein CH281_18330 [Rhodococcus sp. 06-221-2]